MGRFSIVVLLFAAMISTDCRDKDTGERDSPADGTALDFWIELVDEPTFNASNYFGSVVLINFWDTWCGPCQDEQPDLNRLYNDYRDDGLQIIGVSFARSGVPAVATYLEEYEVPYTSGIIGPSVTGVLGTPAVIPYTFIIDRNGEIAHEISGGTDYDEFVSLIEPLLSD